MTIRILILGISWTSDMTIAQILYLGSCQPRKTKRIANWAIWILTLEKQIPILAKLLMFIKTICRVFKLNKWILILTAIPWTHLWWMSTFGCHMITFFNQWCRLRGEGRWRFTLIYLKERRNSPCKKKWAFESNWSPVSSVPLINK